jgi:hypothetical protein
MSSALPSLRLVTEAQAATGPRPTEPAPDAINEADRPTEPIACLVPSVPIERYLDRAQEEIDSLRAEVNVLRRRDETLKFYMHRLDEELRLAARLQQDFLPKLLPQVGNITFHTLYRPAGYVSGDLYDVMRLDERNVGFYMADAVGHGMPAALLTMFLKNALVTKDISPAGYRLLSPAQTMKRLNDALVEQNLSQATFATAVYGYVNSATLRMTFARGGHPSPILLGTDGNVPIPRGRRQPARHLSRRSLRRDHRPAPPRRPRLRLHGRHRGRLLRRPADGRPALARRTPQAPPPLHART